jgi:ATPase subunit of ABC transporter with duplicated ATPase domains
LLHFKLSNKEIMLILQNLSYTHPNKDPLFRDINFTLNPQEKIGLVGNNGAGKSTLLKIMAGELMPSTGQMITNAKPYYVPQVFGQYNHLAIAQALRIDKKLEALKRILAGSISEEDFATLNDDWTIEERCNEALAYWQLTGLDLDQKLETLSGGQKTKVFLAGLSIHQPQLILLDEPGNHLDLAARTILYEFIQATQASLLVASHDRKLLNLLPAICELNKNELTFYGGNYESYKTQKQVENEALNQDLQSKEKALRKAREKQRETMERQQRSDVRGKRKQEQAGVAKIMMNTLRNKAENSTAKIKSVHTEKIEGIAGELQQLRKALPGIDKMKFGFDDATLHKGKILVTAKAVNYSYRHKPVWKVPVNFQITSGERMALQGSNGSGKTTLLKLITGAAEPAAGTIYRADNKSVYIDQDYSMINNELTVYEQAQMFNTAALQEHEIKIRLDRFLFGKEDWNKPCSVLSGGERMRLLLCCLTTSNQSPDIIILDEPTNNLDIQNIEILTAAINQYKGTLMVVSHDDYFLKQLNIERTIAL